MEPESRKPFRLHGYNAWRHLFQQAAPMSQQSPKPSLLNLIARVLLCVVFVNAVIGKLTGFAGVAGAFAAKGLQLAPVLLVAAMALMAVGSALVISGWKARLGVALLLVFLIPTTLIFHGGVADKMERIQLFKNLAIMGGLLLVADQDSRALEGHFPGPEKFPRHPAPLPETGGDPLSWRSPMSSCGDLQGVAGG